MADAIFRAAGNALRASGDDAQIPDVVRFELLNNAPSLQDQGFRSAEDEELIKSCPHFLELELEPDDEVDENGFSEGVTLGCVQCPADINDIWPDGQQDIHLDLGDVQIVAGRHNSPHWRVIPIVADVVGDYDYWGDWDGELVIQKYEMVVPADW